MGRPKPLVTGRRVVESAIVKAPVEGPVAVRGVNLEGDDQADRSVHGGPDQAVYAYASEDIAFWSDVTGLDLGPGGVRREPDHRGHRRLAARGSASAGGSARSSCGSPARASPASSSRRGSACAASRRQFLHAGRPGAYFAITQEGELQAGDEVELIHRPDHDVSPRLTVETMWLDRSRLAEVEPAVPDMLPKLREWYEELAA